MKSFLISDNHDTLVGMRLAGIDGIVLHQREEVLESLKAAMSNPDIGIIILTEKIVDLAHDEIMTYKIKYKKPLIIEIPDRHGTTRGSDVITNYVRESVGIRI
ncbi:V-type ATP synthase subunit F [Cellulosilyticum sp. ST5]|uniref:Vacuolar H+transporting two-sector ATPase F subunit n=1 Tax=Cellulosilyticum lentocellum (strain ATCC 49066 / DSM 5427 / NCIMB 11756 / RHM5) TaxID=642492 RepID=F2JI60_CELLD|nr:MULTISPECIES: V-type ATP synthase subunit F [Cellulosilyticum]ADZ83088.1 Vacuolar H+transporting two-sector ATPase F subunit [Cellulosilyticum lentocellum DSM 5427]QEH68574.1 ATP synthase subunit F [Cellulosilyticum sp. WCF-2]